MKRLYVGNLPWSVTEDELRERFEEYGELVSARIITDRETSKSKGFAFVEYQDEASARHALESENGAEMGGRTLRVDEAVSRDQTRRDGPRGGGNGHNKQRRDNNGQKRRRSREGGRRDHSR